MNMLKHGSARSFQDYAKDVFLPYVKSQVDKAQRVDIVVGSPWVRWPNPDVGLQNWAMSPLWCSNAQRP